MLKYIALLMLSFHVLFAGQKVLKSDNINIYYPEKREQLAYFTLNTIQNQIPPLQKVFGNPPGEIYIYITDSQEAFKQTAGSHLPDWTAAVTIFPRQIIVLKNPSLTKSNLRQFRETIEHEFIHLYQSMFVPLNITPAWFNEGWACYLASPYDIHSRIILSRAIFNNQIIPLEKLADFLNYNRLQAELAYAESSSLIEYLIVVYGEQVMGEIFKDMALTKDFDKTLQRLTDLNTETLEYHWKRFIARRYRWIFLLDIQYIIWIIIPLLVIIVYFIKGHRNKKIVQRWNVEEAAENEMTT